jgi:hypothetical protein
MLLTERINATVEAATTRLAASTPEGGGAAASFKL